MLGYSKKDLLLFSKLHVMGLERQLSTEDDPGLVADCEYLIEAGVMVTAPETPVQLGTAIDARLPAHFSEDELAKDYENWLVSDDYDYHTQPIAQLLSILSSTHHPSGTPSPLPAGGELANLLLHS